MTYGRAARKAEHNAQKTSTAARLVLPRLPRRPTDQDEYDVPMSDEELVAQPTPLRSKAAPTKSNSFHLSPANLPPHRKRKSPETTSIQKRRKTASPSPSATPAPAEAFASVGEESQSRPSEQSKPNATHVPNARRSTRAFGNPSSRLSPSKGLSAPAHLHHMVADIDDNDAPSCHQGRIGTPSVANSNSELPSIDHVTPRKPPKNPRSTLRRTLSATTPKQSQLWSQLLSSDPIEPTPETSGANLSTISTTRSAYYRESSKGLDLSQDLPSAGPKDKSARKERLVDRLKQTTLDALEETEADGEADVDEEEALGDTSAVLDSRTPVTPAQDTNTHSSQAIERQDHPNATQPSTSQPSAGLRTTYARDRSYLEEDDFELNLMLSLPSVATFRPPPSARRVASQPKAKGKQRSTFDLAHDSDGDQAQGIRSIHELRAAGNKKRFMDDNEALFTDIKDHKPATRSRRRNALIELATKLVDKSYLARFVEHGFDRILAAEFSGTNTDIIADTVLCAVLMHIASAEAVENSLTCLFEAGALKTAARCLDERRSLAQMVRDRQNNMSKVAQSTFTDFAETLLASELWTEDKPEFMTAHLIALRCIDMMVLRLRRQGNRSTMLDMDSVLKIANLAIESSEPQRPDSSVHRVARKLSLSVLDITSASHAASKTWPSNMWERFVSALPALWSSQDQSRTLALQVCINMTNNNMRNCDLCSGRGVVDVVMQGLVEGFQHLHDKSDEIESKPRLDHLLLSLGFMINLAEFSIAICEEVAESENDHLTKMVDTFVRGQEKALEAESEEETQGNVAYGFLAVLIGNLCRSTKVRERVRLCLPGKQLKPLVAAIDEFAQYNRKVDSQTFEGDEGREVWENFTGKLLAVVGRLQESDC